MGQRLCYLESISSFSEHLRRLYKNAQAHQRHSQPLCTRKVRIVLAEKQIPFELITEVPWDKTTQTPRYNPLEKLPVLICDDGAAVYDSRFILEYIEAKYPDTVPMLSPDLDERLFARQVEVVTDGMCDSLVLLFFERQRGKGKESREWQARHMRKIEGGLKALAEWVREKGFIVGGKFGHADVAAGSVLGYMKVRFQHHPWQEKYPSLAKYSNRLEERDSFQASKPTPQNISDKIV